MNCLKCPKKLIISHFNRFFSHKFCTDMLIDNVKKDLRKGFVLSSKDSIQK